jgi:hypothetical protein
MEFSEALTLFDYIYYNREMGDLTRVFERQTQVTCDRFFTREIPAVCVEFLFCKVTEPIPLQNCRSAGTVTELGSVTLKSILFSN